MESVKPTWEAVVGSAMRDKNGDELVQFLTQLVARDFGEAIDRSLIRASLLSRSVSSSSGTSSAVLERKLGQRRLQLAASSVTCSPAFQRAKATLMLYARNVINREVPEGIDTGRPNTGFDTLFSFDGMSDSGETCFLNTMNLNMSMKLTEATDLDAIVAVIVEHKDMETRLSALRTLFGFSALLLARSEAFDVILRNCGRLLLESEIFTELLPLLARIAQMRTLPYFLSVFNVLVEHRNMVIAAASLLDVEKAQFVDSFRQVLLLVPNLCCRETATNIATIMSAVARFLKIESSREWSFLDVYGWLDPNASTLSSLFHASNLRKPILHDLAHFVKCCAEKILERNETQISSFNGSDPAALRILRKAFFVSVFLVFLKNLDVISLLDEQLLQTAMKEVVRLAFSPPYEPVTLAKFVRKGLMQCVQHRIPAELFLGSISGPANVHFGRFLRQCFHASTTPPSEESVTLAWEVVQVLLRAKRRLTNNIGLELTSCLLDSPHQLGVSASVSALLCPLLNPLTPLHSRLIFLTGISLEKCFWRAFPNVNILDSPAVDLAQHWISPSAQTNQAAQRRVLAWLTADEDVLEKYEATSVGLDFLEIPAQIPAAIRVLITHPDLLLAAFRNFDLDGFLIEEFETAAQRRSGAFPRKISQLAANLDFVVDCQRRHLPTAIVRVIQRTCTSSWGHFIVDDFTLGCLQLLQALTISRPRTLCEFNMCEENMKDWATTAIVKVIKDNGVWLEKIVMDFERMLPDDSLPLPPGNASMPAGFAEALDAFAGPNVVPYGFVPLPGTLQYLASAFDYAVGMGCVSSRVLAHRRATHLRLPFQSPEAPPDWFLVSLFLATNCNPRTTSAALQHLARQEDHFGRKCFWPASLPNRAAWAAGVQEHVWPAVRDHKNTMALLRLLSTCGLQLLPFHRIERLLWLVLFGTPQLLLQEIGALVLAFKID